MSSLSSEQRDPTAAGCKLCGSRIPAGLETFCCAGCAHVWEVLTSLPPDAHADYVAAARRLGLIPNEDGEFAPEDPASAAAAAAHAPAEVDHDAVVEGRFECSGFYCPSCAWVSEQMLRACTGVVDAQVDFFTNTVTLRYDLRLASLDALRQRLAPLGYSLRPLASATGGQSRRATLALVMASVMTMNIMSLASVRYFAQLGWVDDAPAALVWIEAVLLLPVLWVGWWPMLHRAAAGLRARRPTMDLLVAMGVSAALAMSVVSLLSGRDDIYFETCAGLITIALLARMVEARLRDKAAAEVARLLRMEVSRVRVIDGDAVTYAAVAEVAVGTQVRFQQGETVVFDGVQAAGEVWLSEAMLTGEARPLRKGAGERVLAGSRVVRGVAEVVTSAAYDATQLRQVVLALRVAMQSAETRLRLADRISAAFVPVVVGIAVAVWLARVVASGWGVAWSVDTLFPSVAVLVVACPCAFSLAGASAYTAVFGRLARRGVLVKSPGQLEALARITQIVFDKTGTLTAGRMSVARVHWRDAAAEEAELIRVMLAIEHDAPHPAADALRAYWVQRGFSAAAPEDLEVEEVPSGGRIGRWTDPVSGAARELRVGGARLFAEPFLPAAAAAEHTCVWAGWGERPVLCHLLADAIKEEAPAVLEALRALGMDATMLSGDRREVTGAVAGALAIHRWQGEQSLEEKVTATRRLRLQAQAAGRGVAFVGDGTNDALAMAAADVSVAVPRATDEALHAGGFVLLGGDLRQLPWLFAVGRKLRQVVVSNYVWAFSFNLLFVPLAALGHLTPLAAMALMVASSTAVLLNALRMRRI